MNITTERAERRLDDPSSTASTPGDIYALLGISPRGSQVLARQLYWVRVEEYRAALERGDPGAAATLEALNEALAIILDDRRRAEYDRAQRAGVRSDQHTVRAESARRVRAGAVLAVMLATLGAALAAAMWAGPITLALLVLGGMTALVIAVALPSRVPLDSAFALLGLREDASSREVDIAYELAAQELLTRVRFDRDVIRQLELLDQAYIRASRLVAARGSEAKPQTPPLIARLAIALWRITRALLVPFWRVLGIVALLARRALGNIAVKASRAADERLRNTSAVGMERIADYLAALSRQFGGISDADQRPLALGVGRRSALGLDTFAAPGGRSTSTLERNDDAAAAGMPRVEPEPAEHEELIDAYVVLQSAAGNRHVPIGSAPLRIGSGPNCDLMLPADMGLGMEHALIWQRDGLVLMHVIDTTPGACLVNDQSMSWASLEDGDTVQLARARLQIEIRSAIV